VNMKYLCVMPILPSTDKTPRVYGGPNRLQWGSFKMIFSTRNKFINWNCNRLDWLVFNANFSNISAILWRTSWIKQQYNFIPINITGPIGF